MCSLGYALCPLGQRHAGGRQIRTPPPPPPPPPRPCVVTHPRRLTPGPWTAGAGTVLYLLKGRPSAAARARAAPALARHAASGRSALLGASRPRAPHQATPTST